MPVRRLSTTSLLLASLALLGCNRPGDDDDDDEVCEWDFEQIRAEILQPKCTNEFCHDADMPAAGLDFTRSAEAIAAQLLEVPSNVCADWVRVVPGELEHSLLYAKLHAPPPCGEQMPVEGHLTEHEIACIANWIEAIDDD